MVALMSNEMRRMRSQGQVVPLANVQRAAASQGYQYQPPTYGQGSYVGGLVQAPDWYGNQAQTYQPSYTAQAPQQGYTIDDYLSSTLPASSQTPTSMQRTAPISGTLQQRLAAQAARDASFQQQAATGFQNQYQPLPTNTQMPQVTTPNFGQFPQYQTGPIQSTPTGTFDFGQYLQSYLPAAGQTAGGYSPVPAVSPPQQPSTQGTATRYGQAPSLQFGSPVLQAMFDDAMQQAATPEQQQSVMQQFAGMDPTRMTFDQVNAGQDLMRQRYMDSVNNGSALQDALANMAGAERDLIASGRAMYDPNSGLTSTLDGSRGNVLPDGTLAGTGGGFPGLFGGFGGFGSPAQNVMNLGYGGGSPAGGSTGFQTGTSIGGLTNVMTPQIPVTPFLSDQQGNQLLNQALGANASQHAGAIQRGRESLASRGFSSNSPALQSISAQADMNRALADTAARTNIPISVARQNADYMLQAMGENARQRGLDISTYTALQNAQTGLLSPLLSALVGVI